MSAASVVSETSATRVPLSTVGDWPDALVEPRSSPTLERLFRWRTGLVPTAVSYVCPHSWAYRPFLFLMNPTLERIDRRLCSQICFVVSRDNACRFCYGSFRTVLRVVGYSQSELDRLENSLRLNDPTGADRKALRFALTISRGHFGEGPSVQSLDEAGYDPTAIREIAGIAVLSGIVNRMGTMLAIPVDEAQERMTEQWYFRGLRAVLYPLLAGWQALQGKKRPPLRAKDGHGPFAPWTSQLRGTHVGRVLHAATTTWQGESDALPHRTKLLMLAVVAHGMEDEALVDRVKARLIRQCGLDGEAVATAVHHLSGNAVSPQEEDLLALARTSILYEAGRIQQAVRTRTTDLSRDETIDAVATLGLGNALARLHALASLD